MSCAQLQVRHVKKKQELFLARRSVLLKPEIFLLRRANTLFTVSINQINLDHLEGPRLPDFQTDRVEEQTRTRCCSRSLSSEGQSHNPPARMKSARWSPRPNLPRFRAGSRAHSRCASLRSWRTQPSLAPRCRSGPMTPALSQKRSRGA